MDEQLKANLKEWAGIYNVRSFISDDPVQFPHRFTEKRDIEISAFYHFLDLLWTQGTDPPQGGLVT